MKFEKTSCIILDESTFSSTRNVSRRISRTFGRGIVTRNLVASLFTEVCMYAAATARLIMSYSCKSINFIDVTSKIFINTSCLRHCHLNYFFKVILFIYEKKSKKII